MTLLRKSSPNAIMILTSALTALALMFGGCARGQVKTETKPPAPEGTLEQLIASLPTQNAEDNETFCRKTLALGPNAIQQLCDQLVEPGEGDDINVRYALHGLAEFVGAPDRETERKSFYESLAEALDKTESKLVRTFLIEQMQIAGGDEVVDSLAKLLDDNDLCEPATQALVAFATEKSTAAIRNALPNSSGANRVTLLCALGTLRDDQALAEITKSANSGDDAVRLAALYALSEIGDESSKDILADAAESISGFHRAEANHFYLTFAQRLAENGNVEEGLAICREVYSTRTDPDDTAFQCAALHVMSRVLGEDVLSELLETMTTDNEQVREQAMTIANSFSGNQVTRQFAEFYRTASPDLRAGLLRLLARRGDGKAMPLLFAGMDDSEKVVRLAAIESVSALAGGASINALLDALANEDKEEIEAAKAALTKIPGSDATADISAGIADKHPAIRTGAIEVLVARGARDQAKNIAIAGKDEDETVRLAALKALGALGNESAVSDLVDLLLTAKTTQEIKEAEKALNLSLERSEDTSAAEQPLLVALRSDCDVPVRCALLSALKYVGSNSALRATRRALGSDEPEVVDAAVRSLAEWQNASAMNVLKNLAANSSSQVHRVLAFRGYVRTIGLASDKDDMAKTTLYEEAIALATRPEDRKMVLGAMAETRNKESLAAVAKYLDDETLQDEAIVAALKISGSIALKNGAEVTAVLDRIQGLSDKESTLKEVDRIRQQIEEFEDYITVWEVAGPFREKGKEGPKGLYDVVFAPEKKEKVEWRKVSTDAPEKPWLLDFNKISRATHAAVYARTEVTSPKKQKARLEVGSDDGVKVWVNGKFVYGKNDARGFTPGDDKIAIELAEGENTIMIKVTQGGGDWDLGARIRATDGSRLSGVKYME